MRAQNWLLVLLILFFGSFTAIAQPLANFSMDKQGGCSPLTVSFTNLSSGVSPNTKYTWDLGNGNASNIQNPSAIYNQEKSYTITLTVQEGSQSSTISKTITVYKRPVADFNVSAPKVCLPASVQFNSTSTTADGNITGYQWDFGDGNTQQGFGNQMSHYYSVEQIPTISLSVTNSFGCQSSITKSNIVEILPKIDPLFTVDKSLLCNLNESIQLTNNSTGPGTLQYSWNFGDATSSSLKNPSHQFTQSNVYNVSLTVSNTVGCVATSYPVAVNAAYFKTDFTDRPLCREVGFTSSSFLYPSNSLWFFGDGTSTNAYFNTSHTYATAGSYNVTLINTYSHCKDTITKTINVKDLVNFNSGITMPASACLNSSINFTSTSSVPASSMKWEFGDNYVYNTSWNPATHMYSQPGTYTVKLLNTFGTCSETVTKDIIIHPLPDPKGFIADYGGVCGSPVTITFKDTTPGAVSWKWHMDYQYINPFSTSQTATFNFPSDGYHTVHLTVTNAEGCSRTIYKPINVFRPQASIHYTYSSSPRGHYDCDSLTIKFSVTANQTIKSYLWNLGNGNTSTLPDPQVTYNKEGVYPITLNYITESGCPGTATYEARVYGKPDAKFDYNIPCGNSLNLQFHDRSSFSDQWFWKFGDGGTDYYTAHPYHNYNDTGKYNVTFINHIGHCSDTITKEIYANVLPSSVQILNATNTCNGTRGTVRFDQRSIRATGMTWNFGDGTIVPYDTSNHNITHTYTASGVYQVTLTGTYNNCILTSTWPVTVLLKQNPVLSGNISQLCANSSMEVKISNMQPNLFSGNWEYGQYHIDKFQYNTGAQFTGNFPAYAWSYANYTGTLTGFTAGTTSIRAIILNPYTNCYDTSNYIPLQVNGPVTGFKIQNKDLCFKSPFVFTDTSRSSTNVGLTSWNWNFGDGTSVTRTSSTVEQHVYTNPGSYQVRLNVTDAVGCSGTFVTNVNARGPKAAFTASGLYVPNVPLNTNVSFYNYTNAWNNNTVNYTWHYGDGATSTNYSGSHTYTVAGTNTVMLIASDPSIPCTDTSKQVITVKDFNTAFSFTSTFLGTNSCPPVMVRINNLSVGFTNLIWDFGDGTRTTSSYYPSHIYNSPGKYRITLYTYGYNGLTGTYIDSIEVKPLTASISADILQACLSQNVNLTATTQNAMNYSWDFGDGIVSPGTTPASHPYNNPGIYTPRLIVKDQNGCATSATLADKIVIDSLYIAIKGIPALVCDSALINFTPDVVSYAANKLGTSLVYKWDFGTGNPADTSNIKNPSFRYSAPGNYTVKFRVESPYGCIKETIATIVVNQRAKGNINAVSQSCQDATIQFTGTASPLDNVQWNWNFGNGNTSNLQTPPAQLYTTAGNYNVIMVVTRNGCVDSVIHPLIVNPKPIISALPRQHLLCLGSSVPLSSGGGATYTWTPAAGLNHASIANPIASPTTSTLYKVKVVTDKGCAQTDSVMINIAQPINLQMASAADLCKGSSIQLAASGAISYLWIGNTSGLSSTTIPNPVAKPLQNTSYTVVGWDANGCFKDTATINITMRDLPTVNAGPDVEISGAASHQLTAIGSADIRSWLWSPSAQLSCSNCSSPLATPKMQTAYVVEVKNTWGCTASDTMIIKIKCAVSNVFIPNSFTPDFDGKNDLFYIKGSGVNVIKHLRIYNRWGRVIFEKENFGIDDPAFGWNGTFNGLPAETGTYVYYAEMECITGEPFIKKGTVTLVR